MRNLCSAVGFFTDVELSLPARATRISRAGVRAHTCYAYGVLRVVMLVLLVAANGPAASLLAFAEADCTEDCTDDCGDEEASGGCCPATCPSCACASGLTTILTSSNSALSTAGLRRASFVRASEVAPANPDPSEILHVPKSAA
jgi:hypothetical protein